MLSIVRDEALDLPTRLDAAKAVAPYTNPRLSVIDSTVRTEVNVMALTDEQRRERARQAILEAFAERPPVVVEGARRKCGRQTIRRMATRLNSARVEGTAPTSVRFMGLTRICPVRSTFSKPSWLILAKFDDEGIGNKIAVPGVAIFSTQ